MSSRFRALGVLDRLFLTVTALLILALLTALVSPPAADVGPAAASSSAAIFEYAKTPAVRF
jgi:hypothetical protein